MDRERSVRRVGGDRAVRAARPGVVLAGASNALLYRSDNGGASWRRLPFPAQLAGTLHDLAGDPRARGWAGTVQTSTPRPLMCGASTDVKERSGQEISSTDQRAQFRRVEVWIVPGGAVMPSEITGLQAMPEAEVKKLGCPK